MQIVIITVPHTGTNYAKSLFRRMGWEELGLNESPRKDGDCYYSGHMLKATQIEPALTLAKTRPLVIPLRHPYLVEESWRRRGKNIGEMVAAFHTLLSKFHPLNPHYIPVDLPQARSDAIKRISRELGRPILDSSTVVNSTANTHSLQPEDTTPSRQVVELCETMQPILENFYYAPKTIGSTGNP